MLRRWRYHFGGGPRCPQCGSFRISKLRAPDRIDPMRSGFLNLMERLGHGKLYHCRFCRVQFYDRREPEANETPAVSTPAQRPEVEAETEAPQAQSTEGNA